MNASRVLDLLQSSKARDKNEGLDLLQLSLPGLYSDDIKQIFVLCDALLSIYQKEKDKTNTRCIKACNILRVTVEQALVRLPPRASGYIHMINSLIANFNGTDDVIFFDFINTLNLILSRQYIREHLSYDLWGLCFYLLVNQLEVNQNRPVRLNEVFHGLNIMLNDTVSMSMYKVDYTHCISILKTMEYNEKIFLQELRLLNRLLVIFSNEDFQLCFDIVALVLTVFDKIKFNFKTSLSINKEISIFLNLRIVSYLIRTRSSDLPIQNISTFLVVNFKELCYFGKIIFHDNIGLSLTRATPTWYILSTIYLRNNDPYIWLFLLGLSKLLAIYFTIKTRDDTPKRRRMEENSFSSILLNSTHELSFFHKLINHPKFQLIGLQLLILHFETQDLSDTEVTDDWSSSLLMPEESPLDRLVESLITLCNNKSITYWCLLALNSCIYKITRSTASIKTVHQIVKTVLPLVKNKQHSDVVSHILYNIIELITAKNLLENFDDLIRTQIQTVFESINFSGPANLNNHSIKFWLALFKLMNYMGLNLNNFEFTLTNWFLSKWDQVFSIESSLFCLDFETFNVYISWMLHNKVIDISVPNKNVYDEPVNEYPCVLEFIEPSAGPKSIPLEFKEPFNRDSSFNTVISKFIALKSELGKGSKYYFYKALALSLEGIDISFDEVRNPSDTVKYSVMKVIQTDFSTLFDDEKIFPLSLEESEDFLETDALSRALTIDGTTTLIKSTISMIERNPLLVDLYNNQFTSWLDELKNEDLITFLYQLSPTFISPDTYVHVLKLCGPRFLNNVLFERNEVVIVAITKMVLELLNTNQSVTSDVVKWLILAVQRNVRLSSFTLLQICKLVLRLNMDVETTVLFIGMFKSLTIYFKLELLPHINNYLNTIKDKDQLKFYKDLMGCFENDGKLEHESAYGLFLSSISTKNFLILESIIFNLLEMGSIDTEFGNQYEPIIKKAFSLISSNWKVRDIMDIFKTSKLNIFRSWYIHKKLFEQFPYNLFDFDALEDFYDYYKHDLLSIVIASKDPANLKEVISSILRNDDTSVITVIIHRILSLAYCYSGINNGIEERLKGLVTTDFNGLIYKYLDLIILEIIRFLDTTNMADTTKNMDVEITKLSKPLSPLTISPQVGPAFIEALLSKFYDGNDFWQSSRVYFFVKRLLIDVEDCITSYQKRICVRRILTVVFSAKGPSSFGSKTTCLLLEKILPLYDQFPQEVGILFKFLKVTDENEILVTLSSTIGTTFEPIVPAEGVFKDFVQSMYSGKTVSVEIIQKVQAKNRHLLLNIFSYCCSRGYTLIDTNNEVFVDTIMELTIQSLSSEFKRVCATALNNNYLKNHLEVTHDFLVIDFENSTSDYLHEIISIVFKYQDNSNVEVSSMADMIVGLLIDDKRDNVDSTHQDYLPFNMTVIKSYFSKQQSTDFILELFLEISNNFDRGVIPLLKEFARCVPTFAHESLPFLVCLYVPQDIKRIKTAIEFIISRVDSQEMCLLMLKSVLLIRKESKSSKGLYEELYESFDLELICRLASEYSFYEAGLMIFEDLFSSNKLKLRRNILDLSHWYEKGYMIKIFESIDDDDLINGLPQSTNFESALNSLWRGHHKLDDRMRFELGKRESDLILNINNNPSTLIQTMLDNGLNSTSKALSEGSTNLFEWSWKLNNWTLPAPSRAETTHEITYKALKLIHQYELLMQTGDIKGEFEKLLVDIMNRKDEFPRSHKEFHKSIDEFHQNLAIVFGLLDIFEKDKYFEYEWLLDCPFEKVDTLLSSRVMAYNILKNESEERLHSLVSELSRYNTLTITNDRQQKNINSMMMLNEINKGHVLNSKFSNVTKFQTAKGLWYQNHPSIAISTMLDLKEEIFKEKLVYDYDYLGVNRLMVNSTLVEWLSESRQELPSRIRGTYFYELEENQTYRELFSKCSPQLVSETHIKLGKFCEAQYRSGELNNQLERSEKQYQSIKKQIDSMKEHYRKVAVPAHEKKEVQRYYTKLKQQLESESKDLAELKQEKLKFLTKAAECYLISVLNEDSNLEICDKFFALWFEESKVDELNHLIYSSFKNDMLKSPHKFIHWIAQLVSKISDEPTTNIFQKLIQKLIRQICLKYPYHSLYHLISLKEHALHVDDPLMASKVVAANKILESLRTTNDYVVKVMDPIIEFCKESLNLAKSKASKGRTFDLGKTEYWLNVPAIPAPTVSIGLNLDLSEVLLDQIDPVVTIASSGLSLPKIVKFRLANGTKIKILFKYGSDDLRQDAIMEQVFNKVNEIFQRDKPSVKRNLRVRTYKIVPIGPHGGLIEFVPNSMSLYEIVEPYHNKYDRISFKKARELMKGCQNGGRQDRTRIFKDEILSKVAPVLQKFFFDTFLTPDEWFRSKIMYSHGLAVSSIVGYMLGLGDRHLNNILMDKRTGEPIHIDLGVAFDQGKRLPIPETVPFRLTGDLVDGLGITGTEGIFRTNCEITFSILRDNKDHIISILNILRWDPLYSWRLSPLQKKKLQNSDVTDVLNESQDDISEAGQAIMTVKDKLQANGLSTESVLRELIAAATNVDNLAVIFCGWSPFY